MNRKAERPLKSLAMLADMRSKTLPRPKAVQEEEKIPEENTSKEEKRN